MFEFRKCRRVSVGGGASAEFPPYQNQKMAACVIRVHGVDFCGVFWRKDQGGMWCSAPEVRTAAVGPWKDRAGWRGSSLFLRSTPCQDVDTGPPRHQEQNSIPGQMCCSGSQAWEPVSLFCVAVLHHSTVSNSSLVSSVLLRCSAKLSPPPFISQKLSRLSRFRVLRDTGCGRRWGQRRPPSTPDQPAQAFCGVHSSSIRVLAWRPFCISSGIH